MIKLTPGVWYWNDDTNRLEFASFNPEAKERLKEGKDHPQEMGCEALNSIFQDVCTALFTGRRLAEQEGKSRRLSKRVQHEYVTLDDVKYAALRLRQKSEAHRMLSLKAAMRNKRLDAFLMALILYLSFYLEKITLEKTPKTPVSTTVLSEKKEKEYVLAKLEVARIHLAKVYCDLILGEGMAEHHHMSCGKRKTSSSQKDRDFFESFYNYCNYVAWLVFRRKHFRVIQEEISRLLRSDIFNPILRKKNHADLQKAGHQTADAKKARFPCHRNGCAKRPSINTVAQQRSPMLSTLLPLPKDSAQHLFQKQFYRQGKTPQPCKNKDLPEFSELFTTKVGIIGAHCSELNPMMVMPMGMMEEEEEEQGQKRSDSSIPSNDVSLLTLRSPQSRLSNQSSVLSRATTEVDCS
ncbi:protein phosphatase 1 regulatory subunit 36 isoform X1 [Struthio camelus]|uniref:protein phosphatase 1 regulatory subunit 36 isoform X1 n=1 Tax=Struthio camelus TaxID=8801 RepID=UPI00051E4711|nr:PREDICTED: protein phosphatase 1 regulatory subunit 36 [Struthio camelus australis]